MTAAPAVSENPGTPGRSPARRAASRWSRMRWERFTAAVSGLVATVTLSVGLTLANTAPSASPVAPAPPAAAAETPLSEAAPTPQHDTSTQRGRAALDKAFVHGAEHDPRRGGNGGRR